MFEDLARWMDLGDLQSRRRITLRKRGNTKPIDKPALYGNVSLAGVRKPETFHLFEVKECRFFLLLAAKHFRRWKTDSEEYVTVASKEGKLEGLY